MKYPQLLSMPTAVSDWLEEQLEARGIDAVVYTRYVLSILYRDPVDVICSERELQFSPQPNNKEVRRSSSGRKRFRRSSGWCTLDLSDAEKLKRSAAVQCLMSASDQECGFESLVDELCEKLKQVNHGISPETPIQEQLENNQSGNNNRTLSPADLVKRYYAAFPALSNDSPGIINLIPKWLGSPKKRHHVRKQQQTVKPDTEMKKPATSRLQKFKQFKKHFNQYNFKYAKKIEEKDFWDFYNCENNKNLMMDEIENKVADDDWKCSDDNLTMYDDMIQDNIRNLLDSPDDNNKNEDEVTVEMMNMANMKQEGNNKHIEHHSMFFDETIWSSSNFENTEDFLQNKLKAISIDTKPIQCCSMENEKNTMFENQQSFFSIWPIEKWSELDEKTTTEEDVDDQLHSLSVINHSETSLFKKVIHKEHESHAIHHVATPPPRKITKIDEKYVDLWDSQQCRFKPIGETIVPGMNQYEDGMTFRVNSDFEKIDWRKTSAGFFYVNDDPLQRKYLEFNREPKKNDGDEFVPKYLVKQDDERLQTESSSPKARRKLCFSSESEDDELNGYLSPAVDDDQDNEKNGSEDDDNDDDAVDKDDDDVVGGGDELEAVRKNSICSCSKIGWDIYLNNMDNKMLDKDVIKNIWKSGESCLDCEKRQKEDKLSMEGIQSKLREECILDGEQLLLDLNSVQNKFLEELPAIEDSFNISELLNGIKERKRRHSSINGDGVAPDFFTTRLQEDCLIKIGRLPVLRSMTLGRVG